MGALGFDEMLVLGGVTIGFVFFEESPSGCFGFVLRIFKDMLFKGPPAGGVLKGGRAWGEAVLVSRGPEGVAGGGGFGGFCAPEEFESCFPGKRCAEELIMFGGRAP